MIQLSELPGNAKRIYRPFELNMWNSSKFKPYADQINYKNETKLLRSVYNEKRLKATTKNYDL